MQSMDKIPSNILVEIQMIISKKHESETERDTCFIIWAFHFDWSRLKTIFRNVPYSMKLLYAVTFCMSELYAKIWLPRGWLSRGFQKNVLEKVIRDQVGERSDLIQKLTPNYEVGCKRIMLSSDFLPMFIEVCLAWSHNTQIAGVLLDWIAGLLNSDCNSIWWIELIYLIEVGNIEYGNIENCKFDSDLKSKI